MEPIAETIAAAPVAKTTPEAKFYSATAQQRSPVPGQAATTMTFVVEGPDYKTAWATARAVTRFGTAHLPSEHGKVWSDNERTKPLELAPGQFTVQKLDSMQQRGKAPPPVNIGDLRAACEKNGVTLPKKLQDLLSELEDFMSELETNGPLPVEPSTDDAAHAGGESGERAAA